MRYLFYLSAVLILSVYYCSSSCDIINSKKHGKLILSRNEKPTLACMGNTVFQSTETGRKFCLNEKRSDLTKLTCDGCLCGEENERPAMEMEPEKNPVWQRAVERNRTARIVGGDFTGENQYPWYAAVLRLYKSKLHSWCGGSLITEKVVLSAGHCVTGDI